MSKKCGPLPSLLFFCSHSHEPVNIDDLFEEKVKEVFKEALVYKKYHDELNCTRQHK